MAGMRINLKLFKARRTPALQPTEEAAHAFNQMPDRSYDPVRLPPTPPPSAASRWLPSCRTGLPRLPASPFQRAVPTAPADRDGCFCRLLPHPTRAFPVMQAGRHPRLHFRGLLRLHACYGPLDRSTAQSGLRHEAPTRPVTRPGRSSATRSYRQLPGWLPSSTGDTRRWGALHNPG